MMNLLFLPLGAASLFALSLSGSDVPFWIATGCFWAYCVANHQIENLRDDTPDATAAIQIVTLTITMILGVFGVYRILAA